MSRVRAVVGRIRRRARRPAPEGQPRSAAALPQLRRRVTTLESQLDAVVRADEERWQRHDAEVQELRTLSVRVAELADLTTALLHDAAVSDPDVLAQRARRLTEDS